MSGPAWAAIIRQKENIMAISKYRLAQILSGRHRTLVGTLIGLSTGSLFAVACVYFPVREIVSPDAFTCLVVLALLLGWGVVVVCSMRTGKEAEKLEKILSQTNQPRLTFDRGRKRLVLEQVETIDMGFGPAAETITNRAEITTEEAQLIGLEMDPRRKRLLLTNGGAKADTTDWNRPKLAKTGTIMDAEAPEVSHQASPASA